MTPAGRVVAVEGPCCAGKTTLVRTVLRELSGLSVAGIPCYADQVGGGRFLPRPVPASAAEDERALRALLEVEAERFDRPRLQAKDLLLVDRSVHTLLAHRYALERVTGLALFTPARRILGQSHVPVWPDLVVFLDVPSATVHDRNEGKFAPDSIFIDAEFNAGVRAYFDQLRSAGDVPVVWLDAVQEMSTLARSARTHVTGLLTAASPGGEPSR